MSAPTLLVIAGPDKDRTYTVKSEKSLLGRHQECLYRLNDMRVSRYHCEIDSDGQTVTVSNHGGTTGTLINGVPITVATILRPGDTLQVGETILRLSGGTGASATLPPGAATPRMAAEYDEKATDELSALSGRSLLRYQIGDVIGRSPGSMVFQAKDTDDGTEIALRVMQPAFAQNDEEVQRFVRAMKATLPLTHPNIIRTYAAGKNGPYCWVALELVDGETLTEVIRRIGVAGMLDWKHAFRVGLHVGRALVYAHDQHVIHRDISPANIMLEQRKTAKLGNLMLAKATEGALARQITRPGEIVGDMNYMSPERTAGGAATVDGRSDLFSLGATCYALLSGKPPFAGATLVETLTRIRTAEPLKPSTFQLGIPDSFQHAVLKLLAKRPDDRYQTAAEWVAELERLGRSNGAAID